MTTDDAESDPDAGPNADRLMANLARIEDLATRLTRAMARRRAADPALAGPSVEMYAKAMAAYWADVAQNPAKLVAQQVGYWGRTLRHYAEAQKALARGDLRPPAETGPKDRRFAHPLWDSHPGFAFVRQQYRINADAMLGAVGDLPLDAATQKRVDYFFRQIVDMLAPTNFLATNPDALERALQTDGESLVMGLENLIRDVEANDGDVLVTLADREAFRVGQNIGTTPGGVVFRNRLCELIQYAPATATVHKTPLILFPPWINKFYILDLAAQKSLVKWIVDQGFTLFVVSWVNPDPSFRDTGMDDYIRDGYLACIDEVRRITGEKRVNAVGYCIAGTTLALVLAWLQRQKDARVKSATFFTTLTDFSDPGEIGVYLDNDFVDGIERQALRDGILSKLFMGRTFSFLRSNDLIWQPAIRTYMLGEKPPAFDLLYWNGDGTNLPAKMAIEYLRGLCQDDGLAQGTFRVLGARVRLRDVKLPLCAVACETDHIAHWRGSFAGVRQMGAQDKTFILSQSGHIAGIVNPPAKGKYGHWTHDGPLTSPDDWLAGATFHAGSWWPRWGEWLAARSGRQVPARQVGDSLAPAPGTYVTATPSA